MRTDGADLKSENTREQKNLPDTNGLLSMNFCTRSLCVVLFRSVPISEQIKRRLEILALNWKVVDLYYIYIVPCFILNHYVNRLSYVLLDYHDPAHY